MADSSDYWKTQMLGVAVFVGPFVAVGGCVVWCLSRRMRLFWISGGVTTLERTLNYTCSLCRESMEAGEKVLTLSCDHAFHCGGNDKCEDGGIDKWFLTGREMVCPLCRKTPLPVLPWKHPPPSSPAPSPSASGPALPQLPRTSDLEEALLPPARDETPQEASSSASAPPLAPSPPTSTPDLEEALLPPAHDETPPESSSSASAPPLAQSPPTSTPDLEEALLPTAHDETPLESSSSASTAPPAQSPPTSTPDSEEMLPLPVRDETQPEA